MSTADHSRAGIAGAASRPLACLALLATWISVAQAEDRPHATTGWEYRVFATGLPAVDNIAIGPAGELYLSLEHNWGYGMVIRLKDQVRKAIAVGLYRPDGLIYFENTLYVTEEVPQGRVSRIDLSDLSRDLLAEIEMPEGVAFLPDGGLLVTEDRLGGRLLRLSETGKIEVLLDGLERPEGIAVDKKGTIFIAETASGRILALRDGKTETVIEGLHEPDQLLLAPDGALWITEDLSDGRLLRYRDGRLETIMDSLDRPQGMAPAPAGGLYLAEQGAARVLLVRPTP